ncbi:MAG: tRNA pseudouridine32 synthase/23S rRNA pseudouridine746 synthase [Thiomicrorhabdus sp.]|nr:MAG: tRNA pseudouridine32 synthase/23S rRNA pseudouridine746 synthase [Thiomicrorhabdus sp.]
MSQIKLAVVFSNSDFLVVNKPAGLNFHSEECEPLTRSDQSNKATEPGLAVLIKQQLDLTEVYPVHRLDKMTSGLVIFALNKATAQAFQTLFETHQIQKYYLAISDKKPKKKQGWVIGDMAAARRGNWKLTQSKDNPARTQFLSTSIESGLRLYLVKPITGKTHQIRVALKSIAVPILGDIRYAEANAAKVIDRGYLHAFALQFTLYDQAYEFVQVPESGSIFLKPSCQALIESWQAPWLQF